MPDDVWPEPAYVVRTKRLELRCYERSDVATVHEVILDNTEALRPWMPWIQHEPMSLEERGELLRAFRARFDAGEDFIYGVFDRDGGAYIGGCGLHPRVGARALEIGYWIAEDRWGQGLATELAAALTRVGFERMEAERMEIRVVPHNTRSLAVPRKLGYTREGTLRGVLDRARDGRDDLVVFGMLLDELDESPAAYAPIELEGFLPDA
ncbi:MAG: GNAT family N-acetyltransferase [Sandaracinaceae bacterium]|nr:GNAT family N-acetyltransferase [Sandaracinaceae bacterium]